MDEKYFKEHLKEIMLGKCNAKIEAVIDKDGSHCILNGRGIDVLILSFAISEHVAKKLGMSVEEYCNIMSAGYKRRESMKNGISMFEDFRKC